jgi:Lrp/AsnC family transcriptional regulator
MLDDLDRRLLRLWHAEPDLAPSDLAARVALPAARVSRRLDRLREAGIVRGVHGVIDWQVLGYAVKVSLRITLEKSAPRAFDFFMTAARDVPEITELQTFLGRVDVRLAVIARDMTHWQALYRDRILALPHIAEIEALMHVATVKTDQAMPI